MFQFNVQLGHLNLNRKVSVIIGRYERLLLCKYALSEVVMFWYRPPASRLLSNINPFTLHSAKSKTNVFQNYKLGKIEKQTAPQ